jgi:hypothetical protein
MNTIPVTAKDVKSGTLNPEALEQAVQAVRTDGYVVLSRVIDPALIKRLQPRMFEDAPKIAALEKPPYQFVNGHIQHDPPPLKPYLFREILCNDVIISVTHAVLGQKIKNVGYTGNTNLPGSVQQPVHADQCHLWYNQDQAHPPCALVVNVPVVDMTGHTGSIELWPGSHQDTAIGPNDKIRVPREKVQARQETLCPFQPEVPVGSVLIRDMRLWHRGMPNHSDRPRPMIAMIHTCDWLWSSRIPFPKGTESIFEHPILHTAADFVDEDIAYLTRHKSYDLWEDEWATGSPF